jgi:hypothetical protein
MDAPPPPVGGAVGPAGGEGGTDGLPPHALAFGRQARAEPPRAVVALWQLEPLAQRPGLTGHFGAQNMSPSNCAQTPDPHSASSRHGVQAATAARVTSGFARAASAPLEVIAVSTGGPWSSLQAASRTALQAQVRKRQGFIVRNLS